MATSQNGYPANDRSQIQTYLVGSKTKFALRKGPTGWLLQHFANWFDTNIRDIDPGIMDDWSYAERPIRGGVELSNHASGTAIDVDATKWPLGVEPTAYLTKPEIAKLKAHLTVYEGAIRWGGDYTGRKDPMHFEINKPEAFCARIQQKLQGSAPTPVQEDDVSYSQWPKEDRDKLLLEIREQVRLAMVEQRDDTVAALLDWQIAKPDGGSITLSDFLRYSDDVTNATRAQLLAAVASAQGGDPEALAAALRESLGEQLAADVAARLTVTAG